jgi:hypothetical protein
MPEYKAVAYFGDSSDRGYSYGVGDTYPRKKFSPAPERVAFLLAGGYIAEETEESEEIEVESVEIAEETEDLSEKTAAELKAILKEKGLDVPARANKTELIKLIAEA